MLDLFNVIFIGNELWRYVIFLVFLFSSYFLASFFNYFINIHLQKLLKRTELELDDCLVNSLNPSVTMLIWAGMFYIGGLFLNKYTYAIIFEKFFNFLIIIPVVYFLIKFSTEVLAYYIKTSSEGKKNEAAIDLLMSIIKIILFIIGILLVLANAGYNVTALLTGLGVGGLAFALAAQDILKNFFAGVALIFDRTFNKGERIIFNGFTGRIEELKLRSTKVRTLDGSVLTIPNSELANNVVENVTKVPQIKVKMVVGLEYSTSVKKLKQAKKIIFDVIDKEPTTDSSTICVWFEGFGPYSLDLYVIYYGKLKDSDWPEKVYFKDRVNFEIKDRFEKAKISMAFPTQTVNIKK
jgi:MscS family membrane protein